MTVERAGAVVIGGSAGSLRVVRELLGECDAVFPVPIVICLHIGADASEKLVAAIQRATQLPVAEAEDKADIADGVVYVAPSGYHLLIEPDRIFCLACDPPVLYARPSIDVLFESAADAWHDTLTAILLSGASTDGARGLAYAHPRGASCLVQDPRTAEHAVMPIAGLTACPAVSCSVGESKQLLTGVRRPAAAEDRA